MADAAEEPIHALDQLLHATCDQRVTALAEVARLDGKIRDVAETVIKENCCGRLHLELRKLRLRQYVTYDV